MRSILVVLSMLLLSILSSAVPVQNNGIDTIKNVAKRDSPSMGTTTKRSPEAEPEEDADEAIAYAWFTEDTEGTE